MPAKKYAPDIHSIQEIELPEVKTWQLDNGLPVYTVDMGTQDVVRVEAVFWAGRPYEKAPLVARTTTALLKEGTRSTSGSALAEELDFYGAGLSLPFQLDTANVALHSLSRHLSKVLPYLLEVLTEPSFPAEELRAFQKRKRQSLIEDLNKNDVVAYRQITECFFGADHPYGYNSFPQTYEQLNRNALLEHHQQHYHAGNGFLLLSGRVDGAVEELINRYLGQLPQGVAVPTPALDVSAGKPEKVRMIKNQGAQSAIRMGRRLFARSHPDAHGMYVLATLLGGYFGSRLMENIREDKGYTYNISASYDPLRFDGALHIDTEVSPETVEDTLRQVHLELDRLRQETIPEEELAMVRNYLMGTYLTMIDGPFNWGETVRTLLTEEMPLASLNDLVEVTRHITAAELMDLAQQYLRPEDIWEVVVGPAE